MALDFSSALYLGLCHGSADLGGWDRLTLGAPAALVPPPGAPEVAQALADLQGCERGVLAPSTLHLFWDLFTILAERPVTILVDRGTYPIALWGVQRLRGTPVHSFAHYDPEALAGRLRRVGGRRPIIVADGLCPACGGAAPLREYAALARRHGGLVVLDDTQSLGILGDRSARTRRPAAPSAHPPNPFGRGGGGSLRWGSCDPTGVLLVSSLAKGFGAPVAALSGMSDQVGLFERRSRTRVHCSPPSAAVIAAARHALDVNELEGDGLRARLAARIAEFRRSASRLGFPLEKSLHPVQTLREPRGAAAGALYRRLTQGGVRPVLHRGSQTRDARISFLITASHSHIDIERAASALAEA